jgi:predicted Fe-Mo cluster-binding NifX family protein
MAVTEHRVLLVVGPDGGIAGTLASAPSVVIADVSGLDIARWRMERVDWNRAGEDTDERVIAFIAAREVDAIVAEQVTPAVREAMATIGVPIFERTGISARAAAISAAAVLAVMHRTA